MDLAERISLLTAYAVGLEGVLARLEEAEAGQLFQTAPEFTAEAVKFVYQAAQDGVFPAAQRVNSGPVRKTFMDGWPTMEIPAGQDIIAERGQLGDFILRHENDIKAEFYDTPTAKVFNFHITALLEGLGVISPHSGDVRYIRPTRDDRARTMDNKADFGMRFS